MTESKQGTGPAFLVGAVHPHLHCGECGAAMVLRCTTRFSLAGGLSFFWGCTLYPRCRGSHGAHPDGRPLGKPADKATKAARIRAHAVFDKLWKERGLTRHQAYRVIQCVMDLTSDEAHISKFSTRQCDELIQELSDIDAFIIFRKRSLVPTGTAGRTIGVESRRQG